MLLCVSPKLGYSVFTQQQEINLAVPSLLLTLWMWPWKQGNNCGTFKIGFCRFYSDFPFPPSTSFFGYGKCWKGREILWFLKSENVHKRLTIILQSLVSYDIYFCSTYLLLARESRTPINNSTIQISIFPSKTCIKTRLKFFPTANFWN